MAISLREAIAQEQPLISPAVYDGVSARIADQLGFRSVYIGSYATSATLYGLPDLAYIDMRDVVDATRRIADVTDAAIIVDGEGGGSGIRSMLRERCVHLRRRVRQRSISKTTISASILRRGRAVASYQSRRLPTRSKRQ